MLAQLAIRDIVLVEHLDIATPDGLIVLTGETGAGKSILLDALTLALGGRGDAGLVRTGAAQGQVTAVFDLAADHPARAILAENDIENDGDLILRRVQVADGRTRAFVNDQPVGVQILKRLGGMLVEIHGQHDDRALVDPAMHRALLDAFGGLEEGTSRLGGLWAAMRTAEGTLAAHEAEIARARAEADYLKHAHEELSELAPEEGEETSLAERRTLMMQAEKIAADLSDVEETISGQGSPVPALASAIRRLERRSAQLPEHIEPTVRAIDQAILAIEEAQGHLAEALAATAFDQGELERTEERLFALRAAGRKYDCAVENLPDLARKFAEDLARLDAGEERLSALRAEVDRAREAYRIAAEAHSAARTGAADMLDRAIAAELPDLKLERARFMTRIESDAANAGPEGMDRVEFWVETNPGTRPGPMLKVASGGELARFLLALKVALADRGSAPTLIFDEIDTGVGGAVAEAIGRRLARLGEKVQVLAVTHAPQVAARADHHLLIAKEGVGGGARVATRVTRLDEAPRHEEIARMLAGAKVTDEARAAARRLIGGAA